MNFLKKNILNIIGIIVVFLVLWILYTAFIAIPREELANELEIQLQKERAESFAQMKREINYKDCKNNAYEVYSLDWDNACETMGRKPDCELPAYKYTNIEERFEKKQDDCLTIYKAN